MRPIEIIHSIERVIAAKQVQDQRANDPYNVVGDLNIKETEDNVLKELNQIHESNKKDAIDPDEEKRKDNRNQSSKEDNEDEKEDDKEILDDDPDKGNIVDIIA